MRIAQVVTYLSPDGAFGGPTRVALAQSAALAELGHEVTLFAGAPVRRRESRRENGVTLDLYPARSLFTPAGFAAMRARGLGTVLKSSLSEFDVAHIHMARDLVTLPAARVFRRGRVPYILQPHGMIDRPRNALGRPVDLIATVRNLEAAFLALALTDQEEIDLLNVAPETRLARISNGIKLEEPPSLDQRAVDILFLSRLHPRKRPTVFVEMAHLLADEFPEATFTIVGPDGGEAAAVDQAIERYNLRPRVSVIGGVGPALTDSYMAAAKVFVLPSVNEVFPMAILEAFRMGTPVVTTDSLEIADACRRYDAAEITDGSPAEMANAVSQILRSPVRASELRAGGQDFLRAELDIRDVARTLEDYYLQAVAGTRRHLGARSSTEGEL